MPALGELIPGYDAPAWLGIVAPKGTPADVVERLERALQVALADRDIQARRDYLSIGKLLGREVIDLGRVPLR